MGVISFVSSKIKNFLYNVPTRQTVGELVPKWSFGDSDLASNETIYAAISMISNGVASAPISVQRKHDTLTPNENRLAELFEFGPNPYMTSFQFIRTLETCRNYKGAGYAIKDYYNNGKIRGLYIVDPRYVRPYLDKDSNELYYYVGDGVGDYKFIHSSHLIVVTHLTTDGYTPISPLDVLQSTANYDRAVKEFSINQMSNGLKANLVIKVADKLNKENMAMYTEMIQSFKKNGVLMLDAGKEVADLKNASYVDPNVLAVENITIKRVERVFNLVGKLSGEQTDQEDLLYLKDCLLPIVRMYEQEFSKKLLNMVDRRNGYKIKFNMNGYARGNMRDRGEFYFKMIRSGVFCRDEVRAWEDLPPTEGGDRFYVSRDMCPVDLIDGFYASADVNTLSDGGTDTSTETETGTSLESTDKK